MGDQGLRRAHGLAIATAVALVLGALLPAPVARAADPTRQAQEQLAREHGGSADDFELVYERAISTPGFRRSDVGDQAGRPSHR